VTRCRIRFVITAAVAAALATACFAQALPDISNTSAPPLHTPGHALIDGPHETVNPANGQVSLRFAVPLPPGRQLTPQFSIAYDSGSSTTFFGTSPQLWPASGLLFQRGWSYTAPMLTNVRAQKDAGDSGLCDFSTSYVLQTDDGGRHEFGLSIAGYDKAPPVGYPDPCQGQTQITSQQTPDGWSASVSPDSPDSSFMNHAPTLVDPDGTTYTFGENAAHDAFASGFPITVVDRNGNILNYALSGSGAAFHVTDTLNRTVVSTSGFAQASDSIAVSGMATNYTVTWGSSWGTGGASIGTQGAGQFACPNRSATPFGSATAIVGLDTPEGHYSFEYDSSYGTLDRITYPNGGYVRYVWGVTSSPNEAAVIEYSPDPQLPPANCVAVY